MLFADHEYDGCHPCCTSNCISMSCAKPPRITAAATRSDFDLTATSLMLHLVSQEHQLRHPRERCGCSKSHLATRLSLPKWNTSHYPVATSRLPGPALRSH